MNLTLKNFTTLVSEWAAVVQSSVAAIRPGLILNFTKGAILRAMAEAQASVSLWLQGLILKVLLVTRLATSFKLDVDSFLADFGEARLLAIAATGPVTFARATPTNPATVLVGSVVQSFDGTQNFAVYADTTNSAYSVSANGYIIPAGIFSLNIPVQAVTLGAGGNVAAGAISVMQTGISGVDTVTNAAAFKNGLDAETDPAAKARFVAFIRSLREADVPAIQYAISTVQQGIRYSIIENQNYDFSARMGFFTIVIDDGSGAPPQSLLNSVYAAVDLRRPIATSFGVFPPVINTVSVAMGITVAPGYVKNQLVGLVSAAVATYIAGLMIGQTLSYTKLAQVAFEASPGIVDVTALLLNSGTADEVADKRTIIKPGVITVN